MRGFNLFRDFRYSKHHMRNADAHLITMYLWNEPPFSFWELYAPIILFYGLSLPESSVLAGFNLLRDTYNVHILSLSEAHYLC